MPTPGGGIIRVELNHRATDELAPFFTESTPDNRILAVACNLKRELGDASPVALVSRDAILRIKADALGLSVTNYDGNGGTPAAPGSSHVDLAVDRNVIDQLYREHRVALPDLGMTLNQFVILRDQAGGSQSALARCTAPGRLERCQAEEAVWGLKPRNVQPVARHSGLRSCEALPSST